MVSCRHEAALGRVLAPSASSRVHKGECTLCFCGPSDAGGLDVCLQCFNGACPRHSPLHVAKTGHSLVLHLSADGRGASSADGPSAKSPRVLSGAGGQSPPPSYTVQCALCYEAVDLDAHPSLAAVAAEIAHEVPGARERHELDAQQAAGGPLVACEHVLKDPAAGALTAPGAPRCGECGAAENLWLCLACGAVGCGRAQYDGTGGRGHGASHAASTGHVAAVKLGTVSADMSSADVHCYACDEMRAAPRLAAQLAALGAASSALDAPRAATMAEMQLAQNMALDLRGPCGALDAAGVPMRAVAERPGARGLANLGNTCYMSSVLQALLPLAPLEAAFGRAAFEAHAAACGRDAASCVSCQAGKLRLALFGAGAHGEDAVAPWMFRHAVSSGHAEFSGGRQQDAAEYLAHLWRALRRAGEAAAVAPFAFDVGQRTECAACGQVLGRTVARETTELSLHARAPGAADAQSGDEGASALSGGRTDGRPGGSPGVAMDALLAAEFGPSEIESCGPCPTCGSSSRVSRAGLLSAPRFLVASVSRIALSGWVPTKRDIAVLGSSVVDLAPHVIPGDERASYYAPAPSSSLPPADPSDTADGTDGADELLLAELESMGFPAERARRALCATGGSDLEAAANWLFEHLDDDASPAGPGASAADESAVAMLADAGFGRDAASAALRACDGNVERALDRLLSGAPIDVPPEAAEATGAGAVEFDAAGGVRYALRAFVAHAGASMHCGHYVAYVRAPGALTGGDVAEGGQKGVIAGASPDSHECASSNDVGSDEQLRSSGDTRECPRGSDGDELWYCFNDSRVLATSQPDVGSAYIYVYERIHG